MSLQGTPSLKFTLIAVGRGMPTAIKSLVEEYQSRLQPLGGCTLVEVADYRRTGKTAEREQALVWEAAKLRDHLANHPFIALDSRGKGLTSESFSTILLNYLQEGQRELRFVIGGPDGLHPELLARAAWHLSLGQMTFPHMLTRVMLMEQLYRAMTILRHIPYHR
ncbi:MAG: 23S rRNA (pseudouridine(1915)-N(3))-methyltransferase RlmH [Magnetococcales bacterium]|nr:23S rRNA (pseudouridine(1915)-N(3))-methyltransferase RlmH [Magnetococcales bacterium]NGZ29255.1 23S rRNA (pseudouridine(1915)-N(3))-methyltransferase RlmH [Magnetococcales bacterium]